MPSCVLLPTEIIYGIVKEAAKHHPTALVLAVVCTTFNTWVTPRIYETLRAISQNAILHIYHHCSPKSLTHVRSLALRIQPPQASQAVNSVLDECTNLRRLLIIVGNEPPLRSSSKPQMLIVFNYSSLCINWVESSLLTSLTHLYIEYGFYLSVDKCAELNNLTHIGFSGGVWEDLYYGHYIGYIIRLLQNPRLKVILICGPVEHIPPTASYVGRGWVELAKTLDPRLVARPGVRWDSHIGLFEEGRNIWDDIDKYKNWRSLVRDR